MILAPVINSNEQKVAEAFTQQSDIFDKLYSGNPIIQYKRERVRNHISKYIRSGSRVLELNSGTGEDAIWLAKNGFYVHATDISAGMLKKLDEKVKAQKFEATVTHEICSFTELEKLNDQGPYDVIFSNFAGLNCTGELGKVLNSFSALLNTDGVVTLVILPKFCLWEFLLLFKGRFKTAFRRFFRSTGRKAHIEGHYFKCWYYNPSFIIHHLKSRFELLNIEGLCTLVPPSYIEDFAEKHTRLYNFLKKKEEKWKSKWPWKFIGDYYIISMRKKS